MVPFATARWFAGVEPLEEGCGVEALDIVAVVAQGRQ